MSILDGPRCDNGDNLPVYRDGLCKACYNRLENSKEPLVDSKTAQDMRKHFELEVEEVFKDK